MIGARETETRRRRRNRREARERAYREWVCGGPLVEIGAPVIGGTGDPEHMALVNLELEMRAKAVRREEQLLAIDFARRCCVVRAERVRMYALLAGLLRRVGAPGVAPTHSTSTAVPTIITGAPIPRLRGGP